MGLRFLSETMLPINWSDCDFNTKKQLKFPTKLAIVNVLRPNIGRVIPIWNGPVNSETPGSWSAPFAWTFASSTYSLLEIPASAGISIRGWSAPSGWTFASSTPLLRTSLLSKESFLSCYLVTRLDGVWWVFPPLGEFFRRNTYLYPEPCGHRTSTRLGRGPSRPKVSWLDSWLVP